MVLIGSSFQRLCEVLEGFGQKAETQSPPGVQSVDLRHISLELDGQLEQIESSLWDNWFWNLILDDDTTEDEEESEEEEEEEEEESSRREAEETGAQEGLGGYRHRKSSKKNFLIQRKEKMRGRSEKTARWEKNEELSELTREHKVREKKVRLQRSEEDEDLGEDEEESPKGKRQSAEAERWQKRKKQLLQVKKVPIRGHRHNL
ncbi:golgin subfamily A member 6-like protein 1 [Scleropages formosus]|uniref:golgin subfamily A member 6-like protein 1 n=1 Tax=Scleropages formosus TaxID=113540 RepID=UPI0008784B26|nr:golgin subfamily A member 6-like protein 1 [Scleropages formosus]